MPDQTRIVAPGPRERTVRLESGAVLSVPADWELLPPGDAGLTRRVKAGGPTWTVKEKKGRRVFSKGVWAPATRIAQIRQGLEAERSTDSYQRKRAGDVQRREKKQSAYVEDFEQAVLDFLRFDSAHRTTAQKLARAVTRHATPVGSGTVARTQRIPIEQRAESAVIAWMRHQTTAYDEMVIPRVKGKRREVRRMLAEKSRQLLEDYRRGDRALAKDCPIQAAIAGEKTS
ncbi:DUF2293 domain-containing protein [Stieleria varia]|uniref:DUF2293 domain-containing protein n=1 Tax=Stieleria varia TaxID=2528005 RepID=A0A5C6B5T3_9BACT|nr:DUF2293 domain-containing protein [Stieleria varia]TWU05864.1 hypothetical protein Pla52n_15790 [Stieleria varia]